jgi:hypothetical protein
MLLSQITTALEGDTKYRDLDGLPENARLEPDARQLGLSWCRISIAWQSIPLNLFFQYDLASHAGSNVSCQGISYKYIDHITQALACQG